jgi:Flp pilus assembly protein TadD
MSLLLDALHKASKEKEKAAALAVDPAPQQDQGLTFEETPIAPKSEPPPALSIPFPSLELELEPRSEYQPAKPQTPVMALEAPPPPPSPPPPPVSEPWPSAALPPDPPPRPAPEPQLPPPVNSATVPLKQPSKIAKILSRTQRKDATGKPHWRTQLLAGVAVVLLIGFGLLYVLTESDSVAMGVPAVPVVASELENTQDEAIIDPVAEVQTERSDMTSPAPDTAPDPQTSAATLMTERSTEAVPPAAPPAAKEGVAFRAAVPARTLNVIKTTPAKHLEQAYAALQNGNLAQAAQDYALALKKNPQERDALLGLAYIAHQQGLRDNALDYYQQVLRQDPSNEIANAAVLALDVRLDPVTVSGKARDLMERQPDSLAATTTAAAALAKDGNLPEAAKLFARAQRMDPRNPMHTYNYAVALDRMGQVALAAEQYGLIMQMAQQAPTMPPMPFSLDSVRVRLQELNQSMLPRTEVSK